MTNMLILRRDPSGAAHHYQVFDGERDVGHVYRADVHRWIWGLAHDVTASAHPPYHGQEPSRDAAMLKFKVEYEKWRRP